MTDLCPRCTGPMATEHATHAWLMWAGESVCCACAGHHVSACPGRNISAAAPGPPTGCVRCRGCARTTEAAKAVTRLWNRGAPVAIPGGWMPALTELGRACGLVEEETRAP